MARKECPEDSYPHPMLTVASYGLAGAERPFPECPVSDASWSAILEHALTHRMTGLLKATIDAGVFPVTRNQAQQATAAHTSAMLWALFLERELLSVVDLLAEAFIEIRVLKGAAVAHLDYSRLEERSFIDLDILVRGDDFDRAVRTLIATGFVRRLHEPRPGFDRRFNKATTIVAPTGYELDLHRTFMLGPWGLLVDLDELWSDDGQEFTVGGRRLIALSREHRLLHASYHAALGDWPLRLASLRDVAEMVLATGHCATDIRTLASRWRVEAVVAAAIADTWRLLGISTSTEVSVWAQRYVPNRHDEAKLKLYTHANKTFTAQALSTVWAIPHLRDKAAYLGALVLPDSQYVVGRHRSRVARFQYALREARRGRGRQ
jgi:Uncharacterised nucleotidyltransferase